MLCRATQDGWFMVESSDKMWSTRKGNLTLEASGICLQNFHRTGETDSWKAQSKPSAHQDPGEKSVVPTRDRDRLAGECPGDSGQGVGRQWPAVGLGALNTTLWV